MGVVSSDLKFYEASLGAAEDDETSTVGGSLTSNLIDGIVDELYETITANEAGGGDKTRYAKFFITNDTSSGSSLLGVGSESGPRVFIDTAEPTNHDWFFGEGDDTDTTTQGTAPSGVSFADQDGTESSALILGSPLPAGSSVGIWMQLDLTAGADPQAEVPFTVKIKGRTL